MRKYVKLISTHYPKALVAFGLLSMAGTTAARAEVRSLAAAMPGQGAALSPLKPEDRHGDYLKNLEKGAPKAEVSLNKMIFDQSVADEMRAKFNSFDAAYIVREHYQLNTREDDLTYQQRTKELAEWTLRKLLQYHFQNTFRKRVEQGVERQARETKSEAVKGAAKTAAKAVAAITSVQKALQNSTMNFGNNTKTQFRYDFPSGMMRVGLTSPIVDASVQYQLRAPDAIPGVNNAGSEKLSLGMSKNFEFLNASTNIQYSLVAESLNYGLSKQISGPLSAQLGQSHNIRDTSKDETLFRVNFGTSF